MNLKGVSFYLSLLCFPIGFLAFINILYASYFDYFLSIDTYFITLIVSLIIGLRFFYYGKKVMTYTMVKKNSFKFPTERYLNIVKRGYKDCNLDNRYLKIALKGN